MSIRHVRVDGIDREEDEPCEDPYGEEYTSGHAQKADEEVGIEAIDLLDSRIVCTEDSKRP